MVIDTSALIAILLGEPEAGMIAACFDSERQRWISTLTLLESRMVMTTRKGEEGVRELELLLSTARIQVADFTQELADQAFKAWLRFGKGRHPAGLNLGDCCSYALAQEKGEPLLCKGNDFAQTDATVMSY